MEHRQKKLNFNFNHDVYNTTENRKGLLPALSVRTVLKERCSKTLNKGFIMAEIDEFDTRRHQEVHQTKF